MRPILIPASINKYLQVNLSQVSICNHAQAGYKKLLRGHPEVSIVIPAYNEEKNIATTLASLCQNKTDRSIEIIVVDNNSTDNTKYLINSCGVNCVHQPQQGITFARNMGLSHAKGKYILNADADTIYPEDWIESMVKPLDDEKNAMTYGGFSFIPTGSTGRITYFFYEYAADFTRWINRNFKEEAVNVYGFNSAFKKEDGVAVDGFIHPENTNEDGWLALKLRNGNFGKLYYVKEVKALVWTTDRRIQIDGGLLKALLKRIKRVLS